MMKEAVSSSNNTLGGRGHTLRSRINKYISQAPSHALQIQTHKELHNDDDDNNNNSNSNSNSEYNPDDL